MQYSAFDEIYDCVLYCKTENVTVGDFLPFANLIRSSKVADLQYFFADYAMVSLLNHPRHHQWEMAWTVVMISLFPLSIYDLFFSALFILFR